MIKWNAREIRQLFDGLLYQQQDSNHLRVTCKILEQTLLKDPDQRLKILKKVREVIISSKLPMNAKISSQELLRNLELLTVYYINLDNKSKEEVEILKDIFQEQVNLHKRCFEHYINDKDINLYLFVKNFLDEDNNLPYNAIQLKGCHRCEIHMKKNQECIELLGNKERNQELKIIENKCIYSFKKLQNINLIQVDLHDRVESIVKEVRVYRSFKEINEKNMNDLELIRSGSKQMQMRFIPSFCCESILIELIVNEMPQCSCSSKREYRELGGNTFLLDQKQKYAYKCLRCGGENLLIRQITVNDDVCQDLRGVELKNEGDCENLKRILNELIGQCQDKLKQLQKYKWQLKQLQQKTEWKHYKQLKHPLNEKMIRDMASCFREYNLYMTTAQIYQQKIGEFYKQMEIESEIEAFNDCVECSIRYLQYFDNLVFNQPIFKYLCRNFMNPLKEQLVTIVQSQSTTQTDKLLALRQLSVLLQYQIINNKEQTIKSIKEKLEMYEDELNKKIFNPDFVKDFQIYQMTVYGTLKMNLKRLLGDQIEINPSILQLQNIFYHFLSKILLPLFDFCEHNSKHQNTYLYTVLIAIQKHVCKKLGGQLFLKFLKDPKSIDSKSKKQEKLFTMSKQQQDEFQEQTHKDTLLFYKEVLNIDYQIKKQFSLNDKISFEINDNIISRALSMTNNYLILDPLKAIITLTYYIDFQLAVAIMLKAIDQIPEDYLENFIELFMNMKPNNLDTQTALILQLNILEYFTKMMSQNLDQRILYYIFTVVIKYWKLVEESTNSLYNIPKLNSQQKEELDIIKQRQLSIYISLEKSQSRLQMISFDSFQPYVLETLKLYPQIQKNLQMGVSQQLYDFLITQLVSNSNNNLEMQRISSMIYDLLFKQLTYQIRAVPNRQTEEYIQRKQMEFSSKEISGEYDQRDFNTIKIKIKNELHLDMDFDIVICQKLLDDTSKSIDLIYTKFYLQEKAKEEINKNYKNNYKLTRKEDDTLLKIHQKVREMLTSPQLPILHLEFCIRGIGNHDSLPYIPMVTDEERLEELSYLAFAVKNNITQLIKLIYNTNLKESQKKLIEILKLIAEKVKYELVGCGGDTVLIKVLLDQLDEDNYFVDSLRSLMNNLLNINHPLDNAHMVQIDRQDLMTEALEHLDNEKITDILIRAIPYIAQDNLECVKMVENRFQDELCKSTFDQRNYEWFSKILYYYPHQYQTLRQLCYQNGIYYDALSKAQNNLNAFRIVTSIAKGNEQLQKNLFDKGFLRTVFELGTTNNEQFSRVAEDLLDYFKNNNCQADVKQFVEQMFQAKSKIEKQKAQQKKKLMIDRFKQQNQVYQNKIETIEDEKSLFCQTCKEGYTLNQNQLLCVYIYSQPYMIPDETILFQSQGKQLMDTLGLQSVSYFTIMHWQCHQKGVEFTLKNQQNDDLSVRKSVEEIEWECATKNNVAKCNNIFPIKSSKNQKVIEQGLQIYTHRAQSLFRCKIQSLFWLILNDLKGLLLRFAKEDDLASDSGAGRQEHNIKMIPIEMSVLIYNIKQEQIERLQLLQQFSGNKENENELIGLSLVGSILHVKCGQWNSEVKSRWFQEIIKEQFKKNKYLLNLLGMIDLIQNKFLINAKCEQNLPDLSYVHLIDDLITSDYMKTINAFDQIQQIFTQQVVKLKSIEEYQQFLNLK